MARLPLRVIAGDAAPTSRWLNYPRVVAAKSPLDPNTQCSFRLCFDDVLKAARQGIRQPAFELWSAVLGEPPPVPHVNWERNHPAAQGLSGIITAHACFRGIRRPCAADDTGATICAYVTKPTHYYVYDADYDGNMVCLARKKQVAPDLVFVAYARLDEPCGSAANQNMGVLTHWAFFEADPAQADLPIGYQERFEQRLW